ncbi:hypothetical protein D9758_001618 [Tetrapyrgos nigripes]|uniref:Programmed cell death protein 5 n=1 Tax=Tetrapyrgos nigripes TaxID=182062 RepID=A0A8H5GXP1_9AGAR|nr:hypothetical protein D9758_001618 [Tetrapyrgos nigripes]
MENIQLPLEATQDQGQGSQDEAGAAQRAQQEEQMRRDLMATVLEPAARERLSRISLVSPERSRQIETILIRMVQSGQLRGKVSENQLIELLDQMEEAQGKSSSKKSTIVYQRRKGFDDDDFDI